MNRAERKQSAIAAGAATTHAPEFAVVIPARHASTRLPGKPLLDIAGLPMIVHVARRARASGAAAVVVATDHRDIAHVARAHGFDAAMTSPDHPSGTDRIAEVIAQRGWPDERTVVNVQGDEPLIEPELIVQVAMVLGANPGTAMATACRPLTDLAEFIDPNAVKVVLDRNDHALYFSRAPIPYPRDAFRQVPPELPPGLPAWRHIGIYAYRCNFLRQYAQLPPCELETHEALEQLRVLWHGQRIVVARTARSPAPGVDTPEDLARVRALLQGR